MATIPLAGAGDAATRRLAARDDPLSPSRAHSCLLPQQWIRGDDDQPLHGRILFSSAGSIAELDGPSREDARDRIDERRIRASVEGRRFRPIVEPDWPRTKLLGFRVVARKEMRVQGGFRVAEDFIV